jgi:hypothetical protein
MARWDLTPFIEIIYNGEEVGIQLFWRYFLDPLQILSEAAGSGHWISMSARRWATSGGAKK